MTQRENDWVDNNDDIFDNFDWVNDVMNSNENNENAKTINEMTQNRFQEINAMTQPSLNIFDAINENAKTKKTINEMRQNPFQEINAMPQPSLNIFDAINETNKNKEKQEKQYTINNECGDNINERAQTYDRSIDELVLYGYIREIQLKIKNRNIIPNTIYVLCYKFYCIPSPIICFKKAQNKNIIFGTLDLNENFKKYTLIKPKKYQKELVQYVTPYCHIENISDLLPKDMINKNNELNGILTTVSTEKSTNYDFVDTPSELSPYLLLYEPSYHIDINTVDVIFEYKSKRSLPINHEPSTFLFCNDENLNCIIYEFDGQFYQCNFSKISSKNDFCSFSKMKQINQKFSYRNSPDGYVRRWLNMTYLNRKQCILAMSNWGWGRFVPSTFYMPGKQNYKIECGLFNILNNKWIDIKPFEGETVWTGNQFSSISYYDNWMESVFVTTSIGRTAQYDINKNEWYDLMIDDKLKISAGSLWMENHKILTMINTLEPMKLISIDLRDNQKKLMFRTEDKLSGKASVNVIFQ